MMHGSIVGPALWEGGRGLCFDCAYRFCSSVVRAGALVLFLTAWLGHVVAAVEAGDTSPAGPMLERRTGEEVLDPEAADREKELREEQIQEVLRLVGAYSGDDNALYLLGLVYIQRGDTEKAIDTFERCAVLDSERADLFESLGNAILIRDQYEEAIAAFERALEIDPGRLTARISLADSLIKVGRPGEAATLLEADARQVSELHRLLGMAYQQSDNFPAAKTAFLEAARLDPEMSEAYYGLSTVCARLGEQEEAARYRTKFRDLKAAAQAQGRDWRRRLDTLAFTRSNVAMTHVDVGRVYLSHRNLPEAERVFSRVIELVPENLDGRLNLAMIYRSTGRVPEAIAQWQTLCRIDPENGMNFFYLGDLLARSRRMEEAEAAFLRLVEISPDRAEGYSGLCNVFMIQGKSWEVLLPLAEKAVLLDANAANLVLLSLVLDLAGDREGAVEAVRQAARLDPKNPNVRRRLQQLAL